MGQEVSAALRASRAMLGIVARSVAPALDEVSLPHFRVLVLLETGGPARVGVLADQLDIVFSTFSRSLDRLEAGGWVERAQSLEDRREVTVSISPRGRRLVRQVSDRRNRELGAVLAQVSATDRAALERAFAAFADIAGEPTRAETLVLGI